MDKHSEGLIQGVTDV